jgi:predicted lipid-binding transport protein (Tim44 family)
MPVALIADLLARAGGGQNFGGGGSRGGGGGGGGIRSGGGGGGGFFFLPFFLGGGGAGGIIGFLLLIAIVVFVIGVARYWMRSGGRSSGVDGLTEPPLPSGGYEASPPPPPPPPAPPGSVGAAVDGASAVGASGRTGPAPPLAAQGYDDTRPVGVPERFRGETLPGTHESAVDSGGGVESVAAGLGTIKTHDPAFDDAAFIADVERSFFVVQQAWSERKPELSRQVMADGIWQQHRVQIEQYETQHRRNMLDNLSVGNATIVAAHSDQTYDTITVRILAASADYDVDDASGKVVRGNRSVQQWMEDWVYQRSSEATTKSGAGTLSAHCPNCGAPLDLDLAGVCSYCKAPIMSGKYDWVLTRIEQVQDW